MNSQAQNSQQDQQSDQQLEKVEEIKDNLGYQQVDPDLLNQQLNLIKQEIEDNCPLISDNQELSELENEFQNSPIFLKKIQNLKEIYPSYRRVRRDGSCFYRSYLFQIFERIMTMNDTDLYKKVKEVIEKSKEQLKSVGFEEFVLEDFYQVLIDKLYLASKEDSNNDTLMSIFGDKMTSDMLVMYLRFMTSGYIKMNKELYECYIEYGYTIDQYCQIEVEPIDKEADQIPMIALINYFDIPINIIYLDQNIQQINPQVITLPEGQQNVFITLLYRPGHYDILYKG